MPKATMLSKHTRKKQLFMSTSELLAVKNVCISTQLSLATRSSLDCAENKTKQNCSLRAYPGARDLKKKGGGELPVREIKSERARHGSPT